ncbi:Caveolin [Cooperia oncophora]
MRILQEHDHSEIWETNKSICYLQTHFLDIFGEPDPQYHSIACVWTTSYRVFEITRIYCYKILTLIFGLPIALIAGFIFALFTFLRIWVAQVCCLVRFQLMQF